ncbi:MAG: A/G-specific adenine glycosylase [Lachnospiraceae bacterium]|nr:A/G-specific adenine glycosylase [Lachnospiraceae bacterium]
MLHDFDLRILAEPLLQWYQEHARALPWRENITPYRVWVSEIMLQQTRVEAVKPYFERFMRTLPTIQDLAECDEDRLLKLWEGLGYYNRVRNMQEAARTVMSLYGGCLPADYEKLLTLKGIGSYTAGAIASAAFGIPVPAVDGNVLRVIMRVTADDSDIMKQSVKHDVERRIAAVIPPEHASEFNQALMELGAIVCLPGGEPLCGECPWNTFCEGKKQGIHLRLPFRKKAAPRRCEERTVFIIRDADKIVLRRRPDHGLLAGLYEFPNESGHLTQDEAVRAVQDMRLHPLRIQKLEDARHIFSHVEWHMTGYMVQVDSLTRDEAGLLFLAIEDAREHYPIPSAFSAYTTYLNGAG